MDKHNAGFTRASIGNGCVNGMPHHVHQTTPSGISKDINKCLHMWYVYMCNVFALPFVNVMKIHHKHNINMSRIHTDVICNV